MPTPAEKAMEEAREMYASTIKRGHSLTIREFEESQDAALKAAVLSFLKKLQKQDLGLLPGMESAGEDGEGWCKAMLAALISQVER